MSDIHFDGPCPFLTCLRTDPHNHPVCETCGAVRYGNLSCPTCRSHAPKRRAEVHTTLDVLRRANEMEPRR
jgi:hypothetical protein